MTRVHPLPPDPGGQDHTSTTPVREREDHAHAQRHVQAGLAHEEEEHEDGPLMRAFEQARPWLLTPNTVYRWLFFCAFWGCVIGGGTYLFIWGFPKLIDHVVDPSIAHLQDSLSPAQLAIVCLVGAWLMPVFFIPKDPAVWLAAYVFDFGIAFLIVEVADILTIAITFWLGRTYLQGLALKFLNRYKMAKAVLLAVRHAGQFKVVLLLNLGPIPKLVTHYLIAFPVDITFWPALLASVLGCLPGNVLAVLFGRNIKGLADLFKGEYVPTPQVVVIVVSLTAAIVVVVGCFWYAKRALRQVEEEMERREQEELAQAELKAQQLPECDRDGTHTPGEAAAAPEAAAAALEGQHAWQQQQQQGEGQRRQRTSQELHHTGQQGVLQQEQERQGMTEQQLQAQPTHDLSPHQQQQQLQQRQEQQPSIPLLAAAESGSKDSVECGQSSAGAAAGAGIQIAGHAAGEAPHMAPSVDCTARAGSSSPCIDSGVPPERGDGWETSTRSAASIAGVQVGTSIRLK